MNSASAPRVFALVTVLVGCGPLVLEGEESDESTSSATAADEDDAPSPDDPSHTGAVAPADTGEVGDDEAGEGESTGVDGSHDETSSAGESESSGAAIGGWDPCDDVFECMNGQPFALEPCAAAFDVGMTQCGVTPVCTRELVWKDSLGFIAPPVEFEVAYARVGEEFFHGVAEACFAPEDSPSCVVQCGLAPDSPIPIRAIRVQWICAPGGVVRTFQADIEDVGELIELQC